MKTFLAGSALCCAFLVACGGSVADAGGHPVEDSGTGTGTGSETASGSEIVTAPGTGSGSGTASGMGLPGSGTGAGTATGSMSAVGTAVSEFCTNMLASLATAEAACFGGTASQWQAELAATAGQSGESCAAAGAAATAGRITYDSSRASACLSATTATNCAALQVSALEGTALGTPSACDTVLAGTAATGDPCLGDADCAGASYCQVTNDGCTGTCASQNADGVSCDADNRCVSGNCGGPPPGPVNVCATLVIAYANQGEMCGYDTTTNVETVCAGALVCDGTSNVCVTFVPLGGACTPGAYECEAFSYCDASSHTCTANPGVGGACGGQGANVDMNDTIGCMAPTYCNTSASGTGTCTAYLPDGADCSSPEGSAYCAGNCTGVDNGATATCTAACTRY